MHRFHAPALEPGDQTIALPDDEAQHLVRVLRIEKGREVLVFNGRGYQCRGRVELADKRGVMLRVVAPDRASPTFSRRCPSPVSTRSASAWAATAPTNSSA